MENMWFTEDKFVDFVNKKIKFVNADNVTIYTKDLPSKSNVLRLIKYIADNKTNIRFTNDQLITAIWGTNPNGNMEVNLRQEITKLRNIFGFDVFVNDNGGYLFEPPLDKLPPKDPNSESLEPEQNDNKEEFTESSIDTVVDQIETCVNENDAIERSSVEEPERRTICFETLKKILIVVVGTLTFISIGILGVKKIRLFTSEKSSSLGKEADGEKEDAETIYDSTIASETSDVHSEHLEWSEWSEWSEKPITETGVIEIESKTENVEVPIFYRLFTNVLRYKTDAYGTELKTGEFIEYRRGRWLPRQDECIDGGLIYDEEYGVEHKEKVVSSTEFEKALITVEPEKNGEDSYWYDIYHKSYKFNREDENGLTNLDPHGYVFLDDSDLDMYFVDSIEYGSQVKTLYRYRKKIE